ncbi:MAG: hypothetical protein KIT87_27985 [Anaerolineae bacterium]|nr:hypothetical protein [Anaerolineae bacterium]
MPTIIIEPELYRRVEAAAEQQQTSVDAMFTEAVKRYLWDLAREKVATESRLYRQQHAALKERYFGQYIAMHEGQVVDVDTDYQVLYRRVRSQLGDAAVMITLVGETSETTIARLGFQYATRL